MCNYVLEGLVMKKLTRLVSVALVAGATTLGAGSANAFFGFGDWFDGPGWGGPWGYPGYHGYPGYYGYPGYGWGGYPGYGYAPYAAPAAPAASTTTTQ
jgi:hypothetical protein